MDVWLGKHGSTELMVRFHSNCLEEFLLLFGEMKLQMEKDLLDENQLLRNWTAKRQSQGNSISNVSFEDSFWGAAVESQLVLELKRRGYSSKTIRAYCGQVKRFYQFYEFHREVTIHDLIPKYSYDLLNNRKSHAHVNQAISAVKFYLEEVCRKSVKHYIYQT
ncbi:phage integrase N-terminal SAM-like domain-containing protein [Cohnella sp.]|uniref:phage integrase N-terminal SAM-like domain-containing protein n=1 Tax=Cohnella sp. TaxID=1883426 RepID=UPI0035682E16